MVIVRVALVATIVTLTSQLLAQPADRFTINNHIEAALQIMERDGNWTTGIGCALAWIPGTAAKNLDVVLESLKASIWAHEVTTRCPDGLCPAAERELLRKGIEAEFSQCVSFDQLESNLKRRLSR